MPDVTCVKAGGLDGGATALGGKVGVEFYTKDRLPFVAAVEGAKIPGEEWKLDKGKEPTGMNWASMTARSLVNDFKHSEFAVLGNL
jgi:hypothetical protein